MRVLIATDGSKEAITGMTTASRLLTSAGREVQVLCVAPELRAPKSAKIVARARQHRIIAETQRILQDAKQMLTEEGIDAVALCLTGSPASVIIRQAEEYDITVIGAKGRDVRSNVGLGPVASRVVEHAQGCVLVGRELRSDKGTRILAPVDGSGGSQHALDALNALFDLESAEITLMHVIETPWLHLESEQELSEDMEAVMGEADPEAKLALELRREAEELLADGRERIKGHHHSVTTVISEGNPGNEILREAEQGEYDLVVVAASGAADLKRKMLGSVSSKVAWNAPCSVLVVRGPE
jgi:nucleotide-binding universal stress UspA family protein